MNSWLGREEGEINCVHSRHCCNAQDRSESDRFFIFPLKKKLNCSCRKVVRRITRKRHKWKMPSQISIELNHFDANISFEGPHWTIMLLTACNAIARHGVRSQSIKK